MRVDEISIANPPAINVIGLSNFSLNNCMYIFIYSRFFLFFITPFYNKKIFVFSMSHLGYIIYNTSVIPDYTFVKIKTSQFDGNLYEKKLICSKDIVVKYNETEYILKAGTHYFPTLSSKYILSTNMKDENVLQIFCIHKPPELVVSKIFRDKQVIIDKYMKDYQHTSSLTSLFSFYPLFIPNLKHIRNYLFSIYQDNLMYTKYLHLENDIGASLYHQYFQNDYVEKRIPLLEYKGKIKNELCDETVVENILTSLNNQKIINDPYISCLLHSHAFEGENSNFLKIKYLYKDQATLKRRLRDEYTVILRPPKFDEFIDLYEPYPEEVVQKMWDEHFVSIHALQEEGHISFVKIT